MWDPIVVEYTEDHGIPLVAASQVRLFPLYTEHNGREYEQLILGRNPLHAIRKFLKYVEKEETK